MIDERLKKCADFVNGDGIVCDVGTDHAHLAVELIRSGKCRKVIASDINQGPLDAAAKTIKKFGISDKVELVLSDGLKNVNPDGVSDVIIAGMGGENIVKIILEAGCKLKGKNLILQPMTKPEYVLKKLINNNSDISYNLIEENIVKDDKKYYVIMHFSVGNIYEKSSKITNINITEYESINGFFSEQTETVKEYSKIEANRLTNAAYGLEKSGRHEEAVHNSALAYKLNNFGSFISTSDIYSFLDEKIPFNTQEKWDNSGFLVNGCTYMTDKILLALDIDNYVIDEAIRKDIHLIISHHPVIFDPLKHLTDKDPVYRLAVSKISAICMHTNADKSPIGTNGTILRRLSEKFEFVKEPEIFEDCGNGLGFGWICSLKESVCAPDFAKILKEIFGCEYVRMSRNSDNISIYRFAFCSGSGGSMLAEAAAEGCDAYITGDVKHDVWIDANNRGIALFDCGHFHTENIFLKTLRCILEEKFPMLDVEIAENSVDPVRYIGDE